MKILNIRFKNINSLEGEHQINFCQSPFTDYGVFAITGPNGSGKTSILDAITLALYGETYRFDRPADHVMTHNTTESFSELVFSLGEDRFTASWQVKRGNDGSIQSPEMRLLRLDAEPIVLAATPHEANLRLIELTGMNFRNFTRSIMLAQGDFAAFLNALDSERMDILEKIIGDDVYVEHRREIESQTAAATQELERVEREIKQISMLDAAKREASEHDLADFNQQFTELQEELGWLQDQQLALQKIDALQERMETQTREIQAFEVEQQKTSAILSRLDQLQAIDDVSSDLNVLQNKNQAVESCEATLNSLSAELKQMENLLSSYEHPPTAKQERSDISLETQQQTLYEIQGGLSELELARSSLTSKLQAMAAQSAEKQIARKEIDDWLAQHESDAPLLENFPETIKLKNLRAEIKDLIQKQKAFSDWNKKLSTSQQDTAAGIAKQNASLTRLQTEIESDEKAVSILLQGKTPEQYAELHQEQLERVTSFKTLLDLATQYRKLTGNSRGFFGLFKKHSTVPPDPEALADELENLRENIRRDENIRLILEGALVHENMMRRMAEDRQHLLDGKPCPLCGSLQHPYLKRPPLPGNSAKALADQQALLRAEMERVELLEIEVERARKSSQKHAFNHQRSRQVQAQWGTLRNRLNISQNLEIHQLERMQSLLTDEEKHAKEIAFVIGKHKNKVQNLAKLNAQSQKCRTLLEQLNTTTEKLATETEAPPFDAAEIDNILAQAVVEEKSLTEQVTQQLTLLGEKMPGKGKEEAFYDQLSRRRHDYRSQVIRKENLDEDLQMLAASALETREELKKIEEKIASATRNLRSEESIALHLALLDKQKLIADERIRLSELQVEAGFLAQSLQKKIQANGLSGIEEAKEIIQQQASRLELEQKVAYLSEQAARTVDAKASNQSQLETAEKDKDTDLSLEQISENIRSAAQKLEIAHFEIRHLDNLLKEQERLQSRFDALQTQREQQVATLKTLAEEQQLMQAESGLLFRRRVQEKIAARLLAATNRFLEKLSGRYYLRKSESEKGLALEIEDTLQNNAHRVPQSLSGGETFVVSLALALALSELASNGKSVDSLFLDEGFGSLDAETLFTVITTLESLHARHGKTIGVISHVESVQKRFKARLQIIKKPNGMGTLKMAS